MEPKIRGSLNGVMFFFSSSGMTIFTLVGGIIFDRIGPWAPFAFVAIFDSMILVFSTIFILCGFIKRDD